MTIHKVHEDQRLGIRFIREDDGLVMEARGRNDVVLPIVAALDPNGDAARAGIEVRIRPWKRCWPCVALHSPQPHLTLTPHSPTLAHHTHTILPPHSHHTHTILTPPSPHPHINLTSPRQVDDMVLAINGQTGLSNTQAAAQLRELMGTVALVVRRTSWLGDSPPPPLIDFPVALTCLNLLGIPRMVYG